MIESSKFFKLCGAFVATAVFAFAVPTFAQDAEEEQKKEEAAPKKKFEKVSVVGSRIRRTDFEGPAPVKVIDRKALDDTSYNSVGDYLRDLTISSFGSTRESTGNSAGNTSSVNLRGLGASNTLVLLNGSRMQVDGRTGSADLNLIPEIAIDSTEILKDGASAIYGADALAGVVLFKTRKDFTGTEASVKYVQPEQDGGSRFDMSVITGKQYKNASVTAAFQYRKNDEVFFKDRKFTRAEFDNPNNGFSNIGPTPTYLSGQGNAARWKIRPEERALCDASANETFVVDSVGNEICRFAFSNFATFLPEVEQYSGYANAIWTPNSRTTVDFTTYASQQFTDGIFAPVPQTLSVTPGGVARWGVPGSPFDDLNVITNPDVGTVGNHSFRYRAFDAGNRIFEFDSKAVNGTLEVTKEFGETWEWKNTFGYGLSRTESETSSGALLKDIFNNITSTGAFNPFAPTRASLSPAFYVPSQITQSITYSADSNVSGELFELKNGLPVGAAFGATYTHMYYSDRPDAESERNNVIGGASSGGGGNRDIASVYGELLFPISKKFDIQTATRFDWFSDSGTAFSPMVAAKYAPSRNLLFRSSVGKAFKAPLLQSLYAASANGFPSFIDHVQCNQNNDPENPFCSPQQYENTLESNQNLKPEEAINYNVGVVFAPTSNFSISTDFWHVDLSNVIGINLEQITLAQSQGVALPSDIKVNRRGDPNNGPIASIESPNRNLSKRTQNGLDIEMAYTFKTRFGKFRLTDDHSHTFTYEQDSLPGLQTLDLLDDYGIPKWRNSIGLTYSPSRGHAITLAHNIIAGQKTANRFGRIKTYAETDVSYGTKVLKKGQLSLGVKNVFGLTAPFDRFLGFNSSLYQPLGRYYFANYRHAF